MLDPVKVTLKLNPLTIERAMDKLAHSELYLEKMVETKMETIERLEADLSERESQMLKMHEDMTAAEIKLKSREYQMDLCEQVEVRQTEQIDLLETNLALREGQLMGFASKHSSLLGEPFDMDAFKDTYDIKSDSTVERVPNAETIEALKEADELRVQQEIDDLFAEEDVDDAMDTLFYQEMGSWQDWDNDDSILLDPGESDD